MYTLYWSPGSASMAPHGVLEEAGVKFDLKLTSVDAGATRDPDYLKLNPNGKVPTLVVDGSAIIFESAAIALFIADRHPAARLAPAIQSQRARLRAGESRGCMVLLQGAVRECTQGSIGSAREAGLKCSRSFVKPA